MAGQPTALLFWFSRLSAAGIALAVLVAIRRSRLWAAERLLSKGLAAAMVTVLIGGTFVAARAVMTWLPNGSHTRGMVVATGLVALGMLPLYQHAQRLVDRLLYGQRPTPYSVLAEVTALAQTKPGEGPNLTRAAEAIGRGLGARSCRVTVLRPGLRDRVYVWSDGPNSDDPAQDGLVVLPISHGGEQIGSIAVDRGAVAGLHAERRTLFEDVADSLGAVVAASRTGIELERQLGAVIANAENIAVSRRQAVAEMDSERRTIERDLHDGAQLHLVTLSLTLGLVEHEVTSGQFPQARDRVSQLSDQVDAVEEVLAKTASGMSSIVLSEQGLAAALSVDLGQGQSPITLHISDELAACRLTPAVEAAVYYCCLESVNNARKHATGARVTVSLELATDELCFRVRDEGPGFDPATVAGAGRGQRNLVTRLRSVGGTIVVESSPGAGTTVRGTVPLAVGSGTEVLPPVAPEPRARAR
jgi:signal transduction histidine kinase